MEVGSRKQPTPGPAATSATPNTALHFLRRSTIAVQRPTHTLSPQAQRINPNGQCTHLTMTRLYTKEFHCSMCLRTGPFGWLYRCTQDRELLLEDDMETGCEVQNPLPSMKPRMLKSNQEKLDEICDIFPRPTSPRKRGPVARMNKFAFLQENTKEQLNQYTVKQLNKILEQRVQVLKIAAQLDFTPLQDGISSFRSQDLASGELNRALNGLRDAVNESDSLMPTSTKPWLPLRGGECQFKCCHFCRPSLKDRSFLSIDGIVNDDLPPAAITGFGFHLQQARPVASAEVVKNLGLRPNPSLVSVTCLLDDTNILDLRAEKDQQPRRKDTHTHFSPPPTPRHAAATLGLGLGIFTAPPTDDSTPQIISPTPIPIPIPIPISPNAVFIDMHDTPQHQANIRTFPLLNTIAPTQRRHSISVPSTTSGAEDACQIPLPDQTPQEVKLIEAGLMLTPHPDRRAKMEEMKMADGARPLTPMEMNELINTFGREPLCVKDGAAVMEESVELHVPDVISQF